MDNKVRHLDMIQGIINRMAKNSFALKGWAVTLVAGIFALASRDADKLFCLIAYAPILIFWGLDSYYLLQERLYRALYNKVSVLTEEQIDFDMNTKSPEFKSYQNTWISCATSKTEILFYIPLALISTGIVLLTYFL